MKQSKITADQFAAAPRDLQKAVETVARAIEVRATIPVLGMMRLTVKSGVMTIRGTNLGEYLTTSVTGSGGLEFDLLTSPQLVIAALKSSDLPATFEKLATGDIKFSAGPVSYVMAGAPPVEDMPVAGEHKGDMIQFEMPEAELRKALLVTNDFVSKEDTRYYLNGVLFDGHADEDGGEKRLRLVATDGHRLAAIDTDIPFKTDLAPILLMSSAAILIKMISPKSSRAAKVTISERLMTIDTSAGVMLSRLIDGAYPGYRRVIPKADTFAARLTRAEIKALFLSNGERICNIFPADSVITQRLYNTYERVEWRVQIEANEHRAFSFNGHYLRVFAKHYPEFEIWSCGGDPSAPFKIKSGDDRATFVLMPMRAP